MNERENMIGNLDTAINDTAADGERKTTSQIIMQNCILYYVLVPVDRTELHIASALPVSFQAKQKKNGRKYKENTREWKPSEIGVRWFAGCGIRTNSKLSPTAGASHSNQMGTIYDGMPVVRQRLAYELDQQRVDIFIFRWGWGSTAEI